MLRIYDKSSQLHPEAVYDFETAQQRGFWRRIVSRLTARNNRLLHFDAYYTTLADKSRHTLRNQLVPIANIVGTLNRQNSFDANFNPLSEKTAQRWVRVREAYLNNRTLAPVELHKIGDMYFVEDGHHRISVARFVGQETIEATVIEYSDELPHCDC